MFSFGLIEGIFAFVGFFYLTQKTLECSDNVEYIELNETEYLRIKHVLNLDSNEIPPPYTNNDINNDNPESELLLNSNEHVV